MRIKDSPFHRRNLDELFQELAAQQLKHARTAVPYGGDIHQSPAGGLQEETLVRMGDGIMSHQRRDMAQFGRFALQEFPAHRNIEEQIPNFDFSSTCPGALADIAQFPTPDFNPRAGRLRGDLRFQIQPGNSGNGGQCLAAKPERADRKQILHLANLAGRMTLEGLQGVVRAHAEAIVGDANPLSSSGFYFDFHPLRPGIQRILKQLFHHRGGSFHHLPGGNLVGNGIS